MQTRPQVRKPEPSGFSDLWMGYAVAVTRLPRLIRVASVPATHPYVRRLEHPRVRVVEDPCDDTRSPCLLDPTWLAEHAPHFDLMHIHFGFEFYDSARLEAVCDELARLGKPLVYTVHDLRNPNHATPRLHDEALNVWLRRADAVVTLTEWAARHVWSGWGRRALVLPHPHVVPLPELRRRQARSRTRTEDGYRVGLHFKSLRPNMFGASVLRAALEGAARVAGTRLRIDMHCDVLDPDSAHHDPELVAVALTAARGPADLHVHHYFTDEELWDYFQSIDAVVLPYRFGTHSGWLEAAKDLGAAVIAPSCGGYLDQGAQHVFTADEKDGLDSSSLAQAVQEAATVGRPLPIAADVRDVERMRVAEAHARLYATLIAERTGPR